MKVKHLCLLAAVAVFLASCRDTDAVNVELENPPAGINILTIEDAESLMNLEYHFLNVYSSGEYIYIPEIASDFFNPSLDYGDRYGAVYRWEWNSGVPFVDIWGGAYMAINHAIYTIEGVSNMDKSEYSDSELTLLDKVLGVAYFTKAYFGLKLLEYYAPVYNQSNKDLYGIILVDKVGDGENQGRSTVEESYQWVVENAKRAEELLAIVPGTVGAEELTVDAVHAFQARLALYMGDWNEAIKKATVLVDSNKYPLCSNQQEMTELWNNDSGQECIIQLGADNNSTPGSNDPGYMNYNPSNGQYCPIWIPNKDVISHYNDIDLRFKTWFSKGMKVTISIGTASGMTLFNKFPGNSVLGDENAHLHKIKPFRIAEQYLIAAEAFAMKGGTDAPANSYLNKLREMRFTEYSPISLTGDALIEYIKDERARELIGEGFRWFDLKRWGQGMPARPDPQLNAIIHKDGSDGPALNLAISASDHRWLAPITVDILAGNPQIRDQQNPGY